MSSSPSRILTIALGTALAVGATLATVPANASPPASGSSTTLAPDNNGNVIADANLRTCIANTMNNNGIGYAPGTKEYEALTQSITQEDLDALAAVDWFNEKTQSFYGISCSGVASLDGLQYLDGSKSIGLVVTDGTVNDLTPLAGITNLVNLSLSGNQITDITPLHSLTNLSSLDLDGNQIADITPLHSLTNLSGLDLDGNQIADISPLEGLTKLGRLHLTSNQISDVTPLAGLSKLYELDLSNNQINDVAPLASLALEKLYLHNNKISDISPLAQGSTLLHWNWTLSGNNITDVSSLDWDTIGLAWLKVPSEYQKGIFNSAVTGQTVTQIGVTGATVALPQVKQAANDPNALTWTIVSGDATIDQTAGTVTYNSTGPVLLAWADSFTADCPVWTTYTPTCAADIVSPVNLSFFSGTVSVNVTEAGTTPAPSAPDSQTVKQQVVASTTGGAARIADGHDTYTVVSTVKSADGQPLTGFGRELTSIAPAQVTVSPFTDNGDGTYSAIVSSATPGTYTVQIMLDMTTIGMIPVNFIGADIVQSTRLTGEIQSANGLGFLPDEQVTVTVHSDPIDLGVIKADSQGTVPVSFTVPADFAIGRHTVEFAGAISGTYSVGFDVVAPITADTGGTTVPASNGHMVLVLALNLAAAAAFSLAMRLKRRSY